MTEFNKGDIVYGTEEYRENVRQEFEENPREPWESDLAVLNNDPLRVIGKTEPLVLGGLTLSPGFVVAVPVTSTRESFAVEDFFEDPEGTEHRDVILVLEDEIEHDGGVLAGV